jgi:hypothetical protein
MYQSNKSVQRIPGSLTGRRLAFPFVPLNTSRRERSLFS